MLAKENLKRVIDLGYRVFVVDGGSPDEFLTELNKRGVDLTTEPQKTDKSGPNRRKAIQNAYDKSDRRIITLTELEKIDYIEKIEITAKPILEGHADIVVPGRKSMDSYPEIQRSLELVGNMIWLRNTGTDFDIFFGPRTWEREMSRYFLEYDGRYGDLWESSFIPVMDAIFDGKRVIGVEIDYIHPTEQTKNENENSGFS